MIHPSCHFEILTQRCLRPAMRRMFFGLTMAGTMFAVSHHADAASRQIEPALVKGIVIQGLRGALSVVIGNGPEVDVTVEGAGDALDTVNTEVRNEALWLTIPSASTTIAKVDGDVTVVTTGGGTSHVQIGSQTFTGESEAVELDMKASVPEGTIIRLEGFVGDAEIGDTRADVILACAACDAHLGEIAAFDVSLTGSGNVKVARVDRALAARITGDGSIEIVDGNIDQATLAITGSGLIDFGGRAVDANVKIVGAGDIRLREVDHPIQSRIVGSGHVMTGDEIPK